MHVRIGMITFFGRFKTSICAFIMDEIWFDIWLND